MFCDLRASRRLIWDGAAAAAEVGVEEEDSPELGLGGFWLVET